MTALCRATYAAWRNISIKSNNAAGLCLKVPAEELKDAEPQSQSLDICKCACVCQHMLWQVALEKAQSQTNPSWHE